MTDRPARSPRAEAADPDQSTLPSEPDAPSPRTDVEILREATNLRAARIRDALELARARRLEAVAWHKQRDQAIRDRDAARQALARLRDRRVVRLAVGAVGLARRTAGLARRARGAPSGAAAAAPGPDRPAPNAAPIATVPAATVPAAPHHDRWPGPTAYRAWLLAALRGDGSPVRVALDDGGRSAGLSDRLPGLGWRPADRAAADVLVVTSPDHDPRDVRRETVLVAVVEDDADGWTAQPWFDAFDIVLVPDEAIATRVTEHSAKVPDVVAAGPDGWPAGAGVAAAVDRWASTTRIAIMVQALRWDVAEPSGDYHLARALQRQFERRGHPTSVYFQRQWSEPATAREDVLLHLWGRYELAVRPTQVNALWILYHPELATDELCHRYDAVFAASDLLAERLTARTGLSVCALHQATDPERFRPTPGGRHHELLFVGNSRGTRRTIVDDVAPTRRDFAVYGGGWTDDLVDPAYLHGTVVSNRDLPALYTAADIVLNDHWPESVEAGMINNRLYDALAAGAFVISDHVPGLEDEFDGGVMTYSDAADLALKVERYLADTEARRAVAERGRRAVLARHTMSRRAEVLLGVVLPMVASRGEIARDLPETVLAVAGDARRR